MTELGGYYMYFHMIHKARRPAPFKIGAGTFIYENVAGMAAAVRYLIELGTQVGATGTAQERLRQAMHAIRSYEQTLSVELLRVLSDCGAPLYGVGDPTQVARRVPTVCFNLPSIVPAVVTEASAAAGIGIRDGHMHTPRLIKRLGLSTEAGAVRASLVHYNTVAETHRLGNVLRGLRR
jgi:selenocysteine lyase/cysteine desulfurase